MKVKDFREMKVKKLLKDRSDYNMYEVNKEANLSEISQKIRDNPFQMVVVTDDKKKVTGIVTAWDLADQITSGKLENLEVGDYMNRRIYSISENDSVDTAIHTMNSIKKNKIIIEDENGKFVGVIHKSTIRAKMDGYYNKDNPFFYLF